MNPDVVCVDPEMTVQEVKSLLAARGAGGAPVVDETGRVLGVVSLSDLLRHSSQRVSVADSGQFFTSMDEYRELETIPTDRSDTPVEKVMNPQVFSVTRDPGVAVAANIMRERRIHRLLVTDKGSLVGIVTAFDLLRVVEENC